MIELEHNFTRYLLGELPEAESVALEEKYFTDPQVFAQVSQAESELVDAYVRGQLPAATRQRFERHYLAHPARRERVKFAEALLTKLDQPEEAEAEIASKVAPTVEALSWWQKLMPSRTSQRWRLAFSAAAVVSLLLVLGGLWLVNTTRRLRRELHETQAQRSRDEQRERELEQRERESQQRQRELEQQIADERTRAEAIAAELERLRAQQQSLQPPPTVRSAPAFVSLLLTIGGVRSSADTGTPAALIIPRGTEQVQLRLNLKENNYPSYQAVLQSVGGAEIFSRRGLRPKAGGSGARFVFTVPASQFADGEYILTMRGVNRDGEIDDLGKSLFRVEKR